MSRLLEGALSAESAAKLNKRACCWIEKSKSEFPLYLSAKLISVNKSGLALLPRGYRPASLAQRRQGNASMRSTSSPVSSSKAVYPR
jgi:hypothetical protein